MATSKYAAMCIQHLRNDSVPTNHSCLKKIYAESKLLHNYIKSTITKKAIPTVKLLIKDHKKKEENGDYCTRLVVPAKIFTAGFSHVGQC